MQKADSACVRVAFIKVLRRFIGEPGADVTEQELRSYAKQSLAGFKVPKHIVIREDLPHGTTGKILKRRLKELL